MYMYTRRSGSVEIFHGSLREYEKGDAIATIHVVTESNDEYGYERSRSYY